MRSWVQSAAPQNKKIFLKVYVFKRIVQQFRHSSREKISKVQDDYFLMALHVTAKKKVGGS
jgi:hypothetical protein